MTRTEHEGRRYASRAEEIARTLRADVACARLAPGERLPTEHALSHRFGVSRATVREAIARLKHDGLVESRRGSGAFVSRAGQTCSFRIDPRQLEDRADLARIFELRMVFETAAAAAAASRRSPRQLARIRRALDAMALAIAQRTDAVRPDAMFHIAIAEATGNHYFKAFAEFLEAGLRRSIEASRSGLCRSDERARTVHGEHEVICQAIAERNPERARAAMLLHLNNAADELGLPSLSASTRRAQKEPGATKDLSGNSALP